MRTVDMPLARCSAASGSASPRGPAWPQLVTDMVDDVPGSAAEGPTPLGHRVLQGIVSGAARPCFKKPGAYPESERVLKLTRPVGSLLASAGKTWRGPSGRRWVELEVATVEKLGWALIEGLGFGQPGLFLEELQPHNCGAIVFKLFSRVAFYAAYD
mmetsp:Transcript_21476/g.62177  ORF Transcript_21476/g.62177 Transcript_21476/m.62177 type:complete len:157 (+) Transcript_21476:900-1370(+)